LHYQNDIPELGLSSEEGTPAAHRKVAFPAALRAMRFRGAAHGARHIAALILLRMPSIKKGIKARDPFGIRDRETPSPHAGRYLTHP
jgi:hypothetical protein